MFSLVVGPSNTSYEHSSSHFNSKSAFGNFPKMSRDTSHSGQSRSVKTYTTTEGSGPHSVTKTVLEETVTFPDGRKVTTKKETVTNGRHGQGPIAGGGEMKGRRFDDFDNDVSRGGNTAGGLFYIFLVALDGLHVFLLITSFIRK